MDNIIAESEPTMINSLNFGLPETAQYITDRRQVNYFPSGSNVYNPKAGKKELGFILQVKIIHFWIYQVFVYLLIFKTPTEHEAIFYARKVICHPSCLVIDALLEVASSRYY